MREEFRQLVIEALRRGEDLSPEWARELFPIERREYELTYQGKKREEQIIADTLAVPLQPVRAFGQAETRWHNMLIFGDNLQAMKRLLELKREQEFKNSDGSLGARLIYLDPPFATQREFVGGKEQRAYQDKILGSLFLEFLRARLILMRELLSEDGAIYLHLDYRKVHYMKVLMDEIFGEHNFQAEIIWKRTSAHSDAKGFASVHDTILMYTKSSTHIFNPQYTKYSEDHIEERYKHINKDGRRFADDNLIGSGLKGGGYEYEWNGITRIWRCPIETMRRYEREERLYYTKNGVARIKRYLDELPGQPVSDLWLDINPVNSQATERTGYPTQKPEALLERIILCSSNPGDIVLDAFSGSGTTAAVAEKLGRRWVALDSGKLASYSIQKRMLELKSEIGQKGNSLKSEPFTLYNAGLYDFSTLRSLPWDDWRFFALQLFGCKDEPHTVGGISLDGKRQGASVLVFNHYEHPGQRIDEETILSIHNALGGRIAGRFFIIAPRNTFDFQQDYIDIEEVRYYALRIPYSFINELHQREFSALLQPHDESAVNDIVDSVGFDFMRPPQVEWTIGVNDSGDYCLTIHDFRSRAYIRGRDTRGGLETLSLVMIDYNFDGDVFDLDKPYFGDQLENEGWQIQLPSSSVGEQMMVVFIDIYGNESGELIPRDSLLHELKTGVKETK